MTCINTSRSTRLTEAQARALADWWGGRYHQVVSPDSPDNPYHGVIIECHGQQDLTAPTLEQLAIFSLEEAQSLEQARGVDNPAAPDWIG